MTDYVALPPSGNLLGVQTRRDSIQAIVYERHFVPQKVKDGDQEKEITVQSFVVAIMCSDNRNFTYTFTDQNQANLFYHGVLNMLGVKTLPLDDGKKKKGKKSKKKKSKRK